jgi:hypothetical protein
MNIGCDRHSELENMEACGNSLAVVLSAESRQDRLSKNHANQFSSALRIVCEKLRFSQPTQ